MNAINIFPSRYEEFMQNAVMAVWNNAKAQFTALLQAH